MFLFLVKSTNSKLPMPLKSDPLYTLEHCYTAKNRNLMLSHGVEGKELRKVAVLPQLSHNAWMLGGRKQHNKYLKMQTLTTLLYKFQITGQIHCWHKQMQIQWSHCSCFYLCQRWICPYFWNTLVFVLQHWHTVSCQNHFQPWLSATSWLTRCIMSNICLVMVLFCFSTWCIVPLCRAWRHLIGIAAGSEIMRNAH